VKGVALVDLNHQIVEVCRNPMLSVRQDILTISSDPHAHAHPLCHACALTREDRHCDGYPVQHGHGKLDYREMCACWMPKNVTHHLKAFHMGLSLSCIRHIIDKRE